jgi:hypothetical protein
MARVRASGEAVMPARDDTAAKLRGERDQWRTNAQAGWAALHNIREVLSALAPPGSLPDPNVIIPPDHVAEADQLIAAIHALHEHAVQAEEAAMKRER